MTREEAIRRIKSWNLDSDDMEVLSAVVPELRESEDERVRKWLYSYIFYCPNESFEFYGGVGKDSVLAWLEKQKESLHITEMCKENAGSFTDEDEDRTINGCLLAANAERRCKRASEELLEELGLADYTKFFYEQGVEKGKKERERQKEQKPIIQDVELNDAVYDYVRDHFIAGADFTPEYIKKLMENAFFAGVDYYLLKQESESCEPDTNVEKVIEDVIRVYGKTQGEWVGGYDVDTLIVNLRRAFNKKEQKPADYNEYKMLIDGAREDGKIKGRKEVIDHPEEYGLTKQKELPTNEEMLRTLRTEYEKGVADTIAKYEQKGPKQEWSEEDERMLSRCIKSVECSKQFADSESYKAAKDVEMNWLKSLPKRFSPQPKVEWSEEDEERLKSVIHRIEVQFAGNLYGEGKLDVDWLKSLYPQPHWKPSEDEERLINTSISFLKDFADKGYENAVECIDWLKSKL